MRNWHGNLSPFGSWHTGRVGGFSPAILFALNEPGIWLDPSDVANLDWRRNLLTWTEQFDNAVWVKSRSTITANASTAPDGTMTADLMIPTAVLGTHRTYHTSVANLATQTWTLSAYLKAAGYNRARLMLSDATETDQVRSIFNLTDGTITADSGIGTTLVLLSSSAVSVGSGWYRCSITVSVSSVEPLINAWVFSVDDTGATFTGDGTSGTLLWGAQLELGSVATDYQRISDVNTEVLERFPKTTMFQDRAGSTAVTTPGQSVGLRLDKSKGLVLGPELVTNGDFSGGTTGWTVPAGWSITGGAAVGAATSGSLISLSPVTANRIYRVEFDVVSYTSGTLFVRVGAGTAATTNSVGRKSFVLTASGTNGVEFYGGLIAATIDNISVKELPGNHAVANSDAARGIYGIEPVGGRRNLLTFTEQFDNAAWTKLETTVTANATVAPDGTTTADRVVEVALGGVAHTIAQSLPYASGLTYTLSAYLKKGIGATAPDWMQLTFGGTAFGTSQYANFNLTTGLVGTVVGGTAGIQSVGNGWYRVSFTATATSTASPGSGVAFNNNSDSSGRVPLYTGATTSDVYLWGAQIETGSTATAYQRVTTQYDVTEVGKQTLHYVQYDGSDDGYVTPTITPGIDKVQVFAGVRKLSDAAQAMFIEHSASVTANNGSFYLVAPTSAGSDYQFASKGTVARAVTVSPYTVPITNVLTGVGDISGDIATLRINGTQVAQSTSDQGTGNFLSHPLYIGRRAATSLPFNGRDYGIITRFGTNLDASTIAATESWLNTKTGAY